MAGTQVSVALMVLQSVPQINNLGTNGGTNMAGGLQLAHNIIKDATGSKGVLAGIDNITVTSIDRWLPNLSHYQMENGMTQM